MRSRCPLDKLMTLVCLRLSQKSENTCGQLFHCSTVQGLSKNVLQEIGQRKQIVAFSCGARKNVKKVGGFCLFEETPLFMHFSYAYLRFLMYFDFHITLNDVTDNLSSFQYKSVSAD